MTASVDYGDLYNYSNASYNPIYTVGPPTTLHAMLNSLAVTNVSGGDVTINVQLHPLGVAANAVYVVKDYVLSDKDLFQFDGTLIMDANDTLEMTSTGNIDAWASTLLRANSLNPKGTRHYQRQVGTTAVKLLECPASRRGSIDFLHFLNRSASAVDVTVERRKASPSTDTPLLLNGLTVQADQWFTYAGTTHLKAGDSIWVNSSAATSIDALAGMLEFQ